MEGDMAREYMCAFLLSSLGVRSLDALVDRVVVFESVLSVT